MSDKMMLYFIHMLECIDKIEDFTKDGEALFLQSTLIQDAVYRNLEIIGAAASKVNAETREAFPDIPWRKMVGLRNILIHQYEGVEPAVTWLVILNELPKLKIALRKIVPK